MQSFLGDDTPLGELVDWINQDGNFLEVKKRAIVKYCHIFEQIHV